MIDLAGKSFGKYRITSELGRGGMAIVYQAVDTVLGRTVAIKVLPPQLGLDADPLKRFHREAQLAAQLDHPGIVPIHDVGEQDGLHYIVMKFLEGQNLHDIMAQKGALPAPQAVSILRQVASALDYAHGQGIIHRDIKPSNVIVGPDGRATLTDFGIARAVAGTRLTQHSMTIGTPGYMSPEQFDGAELDSRSDLFSLGVTAYEMLTGKVAYAGSTPEAVLKARFTAEPAPPSVVRPGLGKGLDAVMRKGLAHAPADRYVSAAAFVDDLERALGGESMAADVVAGGQGTVVTPSPPEQPKDAKGSRVSAIVPLGIAAALALVALVWLLSPKAPPVAPTVPTAAPTKAVTQANPTTAPTDVTVPTTSPTKPAAVAATPTAVLAAVPTAARKLVVRLVTDIGGIDDKSFNATAYKGMQDASAWLGVNGNYLQARQQTDYEKNIQEFLNAKADLIVTVGFLLGPATAKMALANPNAKFAIVDYTFPDCWPGAKVGTDCGSEKAVPNVRGLAFQTDQAAFQAGYLAAGMSKTKKVGTFGGMQLPTVTIFMGGFQAGVEYWNLQKKDTVKVLGWDTKSAKGLFTGTFTDPDKGRAAAKALLDEGADVIMPVAGLTGNGAFVAVKDARTAFAIGVDTDQCLSVPDACPILLTSVRKNMDVAVFDTISSVIDGKFQGGANYVGTLANDGVGLAPFNQLDSRIPSWLKNELAQVRADIIAGKIRTGW